jgi:phosphogluconate dehydratase
MCDGVTQGTLRHGAEPVLARHHRLGHRHRLSHDVFDAALMLGICDKIVPGLLIGALHFGHLP